METRHNYKYGWILVVVLLLVVSRCYSTGISIAAHVESEDLQQQVPSKWKLFSSPPSLTLLAYWESMKNKFMGANPIHKPTTDFKGRVEDEEGKGAIEKSMEKTKETIEESAKSAAKMATDTAHKLKKSISPNSHPRQDDEL